jgi:hypothetical protein
MVTGVRSISSVKQGGDEDVLHFVRFQVELDGDLARQFRHLAHVAGRAAAALFDDARQDLDGGQEVGLELARAFLDLLLQAGVQGFQLIVLLARQRFQALLFQFQFMPFQRVAHDQQDVVVVPGLGDVAVDFAAIDGILDRLHVGIAGQQQAHRVGPALAHLGQEAGAIHFRHAHVRNHQVDRLLLQQLQTLGAAFRRQHLVALAAEQAAQGRQDVRFVVDAQDGHHGVASFASVMGRFWGRVTRKVVPWPSTESTSIRPWCFCTMP